MGNLLYVLVHIEICYDYHIALNILRANAKGKLLKSTLEMLQTVAEKKLPASKFGPLPSRRFYISDACFIVGLQSEDKNLLRQLIQSLKNPKWPVFLGRKSFLISSPICLTDKIIGKPLLDVLRQYPWQGRVFEEIPKTLRIIYECAPEEGEPRMDLLLSFATRKFRSRTVKTEFINSDQLLKEG
ncbi:MAG: type I-E CRISPR-associated protein Cas5/CasD [Candidatus Odinarchaeota archaeon]